MIYKPARHGRCRFLRRDGKLTRPRPCDDPVGYRAAGTNHWRLRLAIRIPPGSYRVRSDAVDGYGRHQRHSAASVKWVTVGPPRR